MSGLRTVLVIALLALCACEAGSGDGPVSPAATGSDIVSFSTEDGVELSGRLFGPRDAEAGIVLAHGSTVNQSSWFAFAEDLGDRGYLVLTFNFRGYCPGGDAGCSKGTKDAGGRPTDLHAAIDEIRSLGVERLGMMGSSLGAWAVLEVADEVDGLDLLVALSAPAGVDIQGISAATLYMAGTRDDGFADAAREYVDTAAEPKQIVLLETGDHGAELLRGSRADEARAVVFGWLDQHLPA